MSTALEMKPRIIWVTITFLAITTLGTIVGLPLYISRYGIATSDIVLFVFFTLATGLGITAGYHRLFSHTTYKTNRFVQFLMLFFGAGAFEMSAYTWSSLHRDHHRYVDTDSDPYSIKKGFWYAHIGWLLFWEHHIDESNAKDLQKNALVMHQHKYYGLWSLTAGILLPVAIGAFFGHALGAFLWAVCARLTFVYHATFFINSVCHMFGKQTYDIHASARDHWFVALVTNGEGYHNFHHRFPTDYRNGVRRYQFDPSKWLIAALDKLGLAWGLQRVSHFTIMEAKLAAEHQLLQEKLERYAGADSGLERVKQAVQGQYEQVRHKLDDWEVSAKSYRAFLSGEMAQRSEELKAAARAKMQNAKIEFALARRHWKSYSRVPAPQLVSLV